VCQVAEDTKVFKAVKDFKINQLLGYSRRRLYTVLLEAHRRAINAEHGPSPVSFSETNVVTFGLATFTINRLSQW